VPAPAQSHGEKRAGTGPRPYGALLGVGRDPTIQILDNHTVYQGCKNGPMATVPRQIIVINDPRNLHVCPRHLPDEGRPRGAAPTVVFQQESVRMGI